jgi:hypothetical protein
VPDNFRAKRFDKKDCLEALDVEPLDLTIDAPLSVWNASGNIIVEVRRGAQAALAGCRR